MVRAMVGGCCVCLDERGWDENPLVYCDGHGCCVAVHQACYGIVKVPMGPWFCCKCQSTERVARVKCELCPMKDGALKRTDNGGWAHVVCALYIPEVKFGNVATMQPIILSSVPHERYMKTCYICEENGRESKTASGACMACNKPGCRHAFHVTCAQAKRLLCEEAGQNGNVQYVGYCSFHWAKKNKVGTDPDIKSEHPALKDKEKKPKQRHDSVSSNNSDISSTGRPSDTANTGLKRSNKKPGNNSKAPIDVVNRTIDTPSPSWKSDLSMTHHSPDLHRGPMIHEKISPIQNGVINPIQNGTSMPPGHMYPVNHSQFTMEDLLRRQPIDQGSKLQNGFVSTPEKKFQEKTPASEAAVKKRRIPAPKPTDAQKSKKLKTSDVNRPNTTKTEQAKKIKQKALKKLQQKSNVAKGSTAKEPASKKMNNEKLPRPKMLNLIENGKINGEVKRSEKVNPPQSFQDLLEFQWNEGAQLLMQRAMNFDVASLVSSLHQLKSDNSKLESRLNELLRRRDRLSASNARLSTPFAKNHSMHAPSSLNPLSAMLSQLQASEQQIPIPNWPVPPLPVATTAKCTSTSVTPDASTKPRTAEETKEKPTRKAPRPKQAKKTEKGSPKRTPKSAKVTQQAALGPVVTLVTDINRPPIVHPGLLNHISQPIATHIRPPEKQPLQFITAPPSCNTILPKPSTDAINAFPVRLSTGQPLTNVLHHSPSQYGSTQAALPQAANTVGFVVSHLQHPFNVARMVNTTSSPMKQDTLSRIAPATSHPTQTIIVPAKAVSTEDVNSPIAN